MSARVYLIKKVNGCKVCLQCLWKMNSEDGQLYSVCILQFSCFMQSKHKQTKCEHSRRNSYRLHAFSVGITILNQRII